ncbi:MAG TPA: aminoglycoside phosphotransferase family protein [Blastocatellia bacterium]|nr:aminoglycoside phosphotransferase family protein [Blastocatellia bacterium]
MKEFEQFTSAGQMRSVFQRMLPGFAHGNPEITDCVRLHTRFRTFLKPGSRGKSSLSATWKLVTANRTSGQRAEQLLYARSFLGGRSRNEFERAMNRRLVPVSNGAALTHLAALDMVVWSFPNDPAIPHLPEVTDRNRVRRHLPWQHLAVSRDELDALDLGIISYRPEERCTTRYRLHTQGQLHALYAKTFADERGREIHERMNQLRAASLSDADSFLIARPLLYDADLRTIWQEELPGTPLAEALSRSSLNELLGATGRGLARLHSSALNCAERIALADHLAEARKKAAKLSQAFPHLSAELQEVISDLAAQMPHLSDAPLRLIHGDFHLRQMLLCAERLALFDFDELAHGDPLQDLANFIADLYSAESDDDIRRAMAAALLKGWEQHADCELDAERLVWHLRMQFLTRAYRAYWQIKPDLENVVRRFIALSRRGVKGW